MSVKPLDLQTNIAKLYDVAADAERKANSIVEGQQRLERESGDKSKLVNSRLSENEKLEKIAIKREEKEKKRRRNQDSGRIKEEKNSMGKEETIQKEEKIGIIIDVKR